MLLRRGRRPSSRTHSAPVSRAAAVSQQQSRARSQGHRLPASLAHAQGDGVLCRNHDPYPRNSSRVVGLPLDNRPFRSIRVAVLCCVEQQCLPRGTPRRGNPCRMARCGCLAAAAACLPRSRFQASSLAARHGRDLRWAGCREFVDAFRADVSVLTDSRDRGKSWSRHEAGRVFCSHVSDAAGELLHEGWNELPEP